MLPTFCCSWKVIVTTTFSSPPLPQHAFDALDDMVLHDTMHSYILLWTTGSR